MRRFALLALVGCGGLHRPTPDFRTDLGVGFYGTKGSGWVTKADADELEPMLVRGLTGISWKWDNAAIHRCLESTDAHVVDSLPCGQAYDCGGTASGTTVNVRSTEAVPCFQASSYAHELVHRIQLCLFSDPDAAHTNAPAWAVVADIESTWGDLCTKGSH